ncbi:MAG: hypothetical protein GWN71_10440, partial [Gammaproteobacteria bacterium]|nr:hypothetical protein [Gemmatimonadota bacterium]NIU73981.1 hypothetical protein [Gammaproteobacteria bacterium]NIY08263.1 hypothetical protein [Gemmatimonadota bacterium]
LVLEVGFIWLTTRAWRALDLDPATSAYASSVFATLGYVGLVALVLAVLSASAVAYGARHPRDPRWQAPAVNASLLAGFTAAAAWIAYATVYFGPVLLAGGG